jgi:hypothetical protein
MKSARQKRQHVLIIPEMYRLPIQAGGNFAPRRAQDYLANRAPLAVAPFKASKTERERIAVDLFEVFERGSVWEIDGVRSLALLFQSARPYGACRVVG